MSTLKTGLLMIALTALLMLIGSFFGEGGIIIAFVFAVIMNFGSYWFSDKIVLSMYKAQEVGSSHELYQIVQQQTQRSGLPMPRVYVIPNESPNAFATGRNPKHAGVIAHELAHIKNRDILICSIVATMAGAIMMVASMAQWAAIFGGFHSDDDEDSGGIISLLFMIIVAPLAATIIQLAISRSREYAADRGGAEICGNPLWLSNALRKLERGVAVQPMRANEATSHLFIVNPLRGGFSRLFSTHPPMEERIRLLEGMSGSRRMI